MKGAVLSLNHVIMDTDQLVFQSWQELAMYEFGMGLPGKMAQQFKGLDRHQALALILQHFKQTDVDQDELLNEQSEMYSKAIEGVDEEQLFPNAKRLLNNFYDHYVDLAMNDTDGHAKEILQKLDVADFFDVYINSDKATNPYLMASQQLNVQPADCIGIGISKQEIALMNQAGVISIGIGNADELMEAKYQVTQVGDLKYPMLRKVWEDAQ